jgi:hypothetical protein
MIQRIVLLLGYLEPVLCAVTFYILLRSKAANKFRFLAALLAAKALSSIVCMALWYLSGRFIESTFAYKIYFYVYWGSYAVEAILSLLVIYSIFKMAMAPLQGLQRLGMLVFRWVAAISVAVAIGVALAPHASTTKFIIAMVTQLQQTSSILTLCLLLFVCFAIRPMGLSYRSRIFGVSFGLGFLATTELVRSAWLTHFSNVSSTINVINGLAICLTLAVWSVYFAYPEPKRKFILLPTTSPFLRWNQIAQVLGDEPGYVAVGAVSPEIFAPAELEIMARASEKMSPRLEAPVGPQRIAV